MSLLDRTKEVFIQCDDCAERMVFKKHFWEHDEVSFEFVVEDSYCGGNRHGLGDRLRRAWRAFWAKPVYYTGVYIDDPARVNTFLENCMKLYEEEQP